MIKEGILALELGFRALVGQGSPVIEQPVIPNHCLNTESLARALGGNGEIAQRYGDRWAAVASDFTAGGPPRFRGRAFDVESNSPRILAVQEGDELQVIVTNPDGGSTVRFIIGPREEAVQFATYLCAPRANTSPRNEWER